MPALTLALPLIMACASPGDLPLRVPAPAAGETTIRLRYARGVQASSPREAVFRVRIRPVDQ